MNSQERSLFTVIEKISDCRILQKLCSNCTRYRKPQKEQYRFQLQIAANYPDLDYLIAIAPTLYKFAGRRAEQKNKYRGEFFPANYPANEDGLTYIDFFQ